MDFWDLTKLLLRRWYVAVPLLLLSGGAVLWTQSTVQPKYLASSWIQLVPPTVISEKEPGSTVARNINPWFDLGLASLANAATVQVKDEETLNSLKAQGLSDNFTLTVNSSTTTIVMEIVGDSRAQAASSSDALVSLIEERVRDLQTAYAVQTSELITTKRLDLGTNIAESNGNVKKAVIAVGGVGVLLTGAMTIGIDALVRQQARRRRRGGDPDMAFAPAADRPATAGPGAGPERREKTMPQPVRFPSVPLPSAASSISLPAQAPVERPREGEYAPDSTVILPLSTPKRL